MVELKRKDWEHVKFVSEENIRGALLQQKIAKMQLDLAEKELAKLPEEVIENKAVK